MEEAPSQGPCVLCWQWEQAERRQGALAGKVPCDRLLLLLLLLEGHLGSTAERGGEEQQAALAQPGERQGRW